MSTAVLILMVDIILMAVILRCPRFRMQRFHMFITSLAMADILVGLIMPLMTLALKEQMWPFGSTLCQVFTSIQKISIAASFFNFLRILFQIEINPIQTMTNRYIFISLPKQYCWQLNRTERNCDLQVQLCSPPSKSKDNPSMIFNEKLLMVFSMLGRV